MNKKLDNAQNLYLKGIKQGDIDVVDTYTGNRYTQHSTGVADGTAGFKAFFQDFLQRTSCRDIRLIRGFEDGSYVFLHAYQDIDNGAAKWITTDMFDTDDNDKIIEHWDVIAPYVAPDNTVSGNDPILANVDIEGFAPKDLDKTAANKATIRLFLTDILQNRNIEALDRYVSANLIEHNPKRANGIESLRNYLNETAVFYDFVFHVMGKGDYVVAYSKVTEHNMEQAVFDIFRLEHSKIVEHWDNKEQILERDTWANTGKF